MNVINNRCMKCMSIILGKTIQSNLMRSSSQPQKTCLALAQFVHAQCYMLQPSPFTLTLPCPQTLPLLVPFGVTLHEFLVKWQRSTFWIYQPKKKTTGRLIHLDVTFIQIGPLWYTSVPVEPFCMRHLLHSPSPNLPAAYVLSPRHSLALWRSWEDSSFGKIGIKHLLTSPVVTGHLRETVISLRHAALGLASGCIW